jgi:hypothetical protein
MLVKLTTNAITIMTVVVSHSWNQFYEIEKNIGFEIMSYMSTLAWDCRLSLWHFVTSVKAYL